MTTRHAIISKHIQHPFSIVEDDQGNWDIECDFTVDINKDAIEFEYQQQLKLAQTREETSNRILAIASLEDQVNAQSTVLAIITEPNWQDNQEYVATIKHLKQQLDAIKQTLAHGQALKEAIKQTQSLSELDKIDPCNGNNWE